MIGMIPSSNKLVERCDPGEMPAVTATTVNANWDTHKTDAPAEISNLVYDITVKDVTTTFDGTAAICFSRNGKFYGGDENVIAADGAPINFILLCSAKRSNDCNIWRQDYGANKDIKDIFFQSCVHLLHLDVVQKQMIKKIYT